MTHISVNVNKFALLRNSRGENQPNLIDICQKCINYGANGITVHPRPDERHAKFSDLSSISELISSYEDIEFNIEGYPSDFFIEKVIKIRPDQVTLVPDPPNAITSSFGWNCSEHKKFLEKNVNKLQESNIRVSLFINPSNDTLENLESIKPNRVELYTFDYANNFLSNKINAIKPYKKVFDFISENFPKIKFNAGHDLNLENLDFFLKEIASISEVSIGHALVLDAFNYGLEKTIKKYLEITKKY
tara:strand:- start:471 stop:1208 length:738 start_codon:yes stop_codon:yes gene_type:complete